MKRSAYVILLAAAGVVIATGGCKSKELTRDKARALILQTVPPKNEWLISSEIFAAGQQAGLWTLDCDFPEPAPKKSSWVELKSGDREDGCELQGEKGNLVCGDKTFQLKVYEAMTDEEPATGVVKRLFMSPKSPSGRWRLLDICLGEEITCGTNLAVADLTTGAYQAFLMSRMHGQELHHWVNWGPADQYAVIFQYEFHHGDYFPSLYRVTFPPPSTGRWSSDGETMRFEKDADREGREFRIATDGTLTMQWGDHPSFKRLSSSAADSSNPFLGTWEPTDIEKRREITALVIKGDGTFSWVPNEPSVMSEIAETPRPASVVPLKLFLSTATQVKPDSEEFTVLAQSWDPKQGGKTILRVDPKKLTYRRTCSQRALTEVGKKYVASVEQNPGGEAASARGGFDWNQFGATIAGQPYNQWGKAVLVNPVEVDVEITGITTPPLGGAETIKVVEFTWHFKELPEPLAAAMAPALGGKRVIGPNAGSVPGKGEAHMQLYDDGWRIQHIQGIRYVPGKDESFQVAG